MAREAGKSARVMEFERAQKLTTTGVVKEWGLLREAVRIISESSHGIILGILADSPTDALHYLRSWVVALRVSRGMLTAFDDSGLQVPIDLLAVGPVYVKYNSSDSGNAYMKISNGDLSGIIFQPSIDGKDFLQFAYLPLRLYQQT